MAKNTQKEQNMQVDNLEEIKRKRREAGEAAKLSKLSEVNHREEFRKFFAKVSGKLKLEKSMEQVIWLHYKASGFAEKDKFEEGLKHFGYKL